MSGTGYYREDMVPPEHRGKVWPHRAVERGPDGERVERMVQSPFPPATVGVPAVDEPAFRDFQNWQSRNRRQQHPEYYCEGCGIRYAVAICPKPPKGSKLRGGCGPGRTVLESNGRYRCVSCKHVFAADRLCGPCIGTRTGTEAAVPS